MDPVLAAEAGQMGASSGLGFLGMGIGVGLVLIGAAAGIGKLAAAALEGTARQPEASGDLRTSMLIPAALIEGIALFGIVVCLVLGLVSIPSHSTDEKEAIWGADKALKVRAAEKAEEKQ